SITVVYAGDGNYTTSTSSTLTETVNQASTTTAVTSSDSTAVTGETVTFTATITPVSPSSGTPTGTVTFKDGNDTLGTGTLNASGQATLSTSALSVASHSITVTYGGDSDYLASTSATYTQTVSKADAIATVSSSVNPSVFGQTVTF